MVRGQRHENDAAKMVVVCAPSLSKTMGALHPAGALYERPVNLSRAGEAHSAFVSLLKRRGIEVRDVRSILGENVSWSVGDRVQLEDLAAKCLTYEFQSQADRDGCSFEDNRDEAETPSSIQGKLTEAEKFYVSDDYKRLVLEEMNEQQLIDIVFTHPTVTVSPSPRDTGFIASYRFKPLSNIIFVRDQQITTRKGIVMARLRSPQRQREVDILEFCFKKLHLDVIGRIPASGHMEGGDFFPAGEKLCFIGIGPRSDWPAVEYLLREDLFGTDTVAVVKDERERKQERMHLDTVFNILSEDCCIMLREMIGTESATHRTVDEYVKVDESSDSEINAAVNGHVHGDARIGPYVLKRADIEFSSYVQEAGFSIIEISDEEQLNYACNMLNLGNGQVVSVEKKTARRISNSPHFKGTVEYLDFEGVTCMYGGVHCASQVVHRAQV